MSIDIDKDVFGLQVTIQHILVVNVLEAEQDFGKVKLGLSLREEALVLKEVEEFATRAEVDHKVQVVIRVKGGEELDDKGVVTKAFHDFELAKNLLVATLLLQNEGLAHCFDRVKCARIFLSGKVDLLCEAALANDLDLFEVLHAQSGNLRSFPLFGLRSYITCVFLLHLFRKDSH